MKKISLLKREADTATINKSTRCITLNNATACSQYANAISVPIRKIELSRIFMKHSRKARNA